MGDLEVMIQRQRDALVFLRKYADRFDSKQDSLRTSGYVTSLAQRVDDIFNIFESQHQEILRVVQEESLDEGHVPYLDEDFYFEFSELYFTFKGKLLDALPHNSTQSPFASTFAVPHSRVDTTIGVDTRLPKISLPKFTGEYMEWISFRDIYFSLVHNNDSLTKIQKFYYLKGTLSGEAANLIKNISATDANYDSAWNILESRYHNKRIIVGNLIGKLFGIEKSDGGYISIKNLLDSTQECLSSLRNLGMDTQSWDPIIIHLIGQKLDLQTRKEWEQSLRSSTEIPNRAEMFEFLERTFRTLESLRDNFPMDNMRGNSKNVKSSKMSSKRTTCNAGKISKPVKGQCSYCNKLHPLAKCYKFLALSFSDKNKYVSTSGICRNCLFPGHNPDTCVSPFRCITCHQPHHTVLHSTEPEVPDSINENCPTSSNNRITSHFGNSFQSVLLYTIRLIVNSNHGRFPLRALLDPGSQGSLITESAVQMMGLKKDRCNYEVVGIGEGKCSFSRFSVDVSLFTRRNEPVISCRALVLTNLSSYTPEYFSRNISLPNIDSENLADPQFYNADKIDMILGSDICSMIKIPAESFVHGELFFQNTHFGWVFSGRTGSISSNRVHIHNTNLESILKSFWEQEEVASSRDLNAEEISCEAHFERTTKRTRCGHYEVDLPFKSLLRDNSLPVVSNNVDNAFRRFRQLEISFSRRSTFADSYRTFMREYESLGHMSRIGTYPRDVRHNSYFLPHHGVFKEDSSTTKMRVVFDGSSHRKGMDSLNDLLSAGPALQNELPTVITQWRRHRIAFTADIEKMFRQIMVSPHHRKFQQILWRFRPFEEISIYELNTVTYGTTSAPYLAIRVLRKLAHDFYSEFPEASRILLSDTYVDDILSGSDSFENALLLYRDLCGLLKKAGCNLRKWTTNSVDLLREIPEEHRDPSIVFDFSKDKTIKTLGIQWNTDDDSFSFKIVLAESHTPTKRSILSESARLYDPLGWLTPCTVVAKSIFKSLWEHGVDWDSEIPESISNRWLKYRFSLPDLERIRIPRWINWSKHSKVELHCFCDASTVAYAAVAYTRVVTTSNIVVNLIQAKSKISPIKVLTIPRLELCAASLLIKVVQKIKISLRDLQISKFYYWSDSSTVLSWIRKSPSNWNVFVANRVAEIQRFSDPLEWRYIPSGLNPADSASRGIIPGELVENEIWWRGPNFLYESSDLWPQNLPNLETNLEEKGAKISAHNSEVLQYPEILQKYSKLETLLRVLSLCTRFVHNCQDKRNKQIGFLTTSEINLTLHSLVKLTQKIDFPDEFKLLALKRQIRNSSILKLMPYLDEDGIVRVGGRLQNSDLPYCVKHPIILAKSNPLSKLLILDAHIRTLHGGITLTMSYVNRKFWIVSGNQLAKTIIHRCMPCFRQSAKTARQIMGNLPSIRIKPSRPFKHSGVDFAGPITIKASSVRSSATSKGYICLFICMVTKAIHLEAVSDLTTNAFLAAFRRFVARRGACTDLYSDCGTNFIGASKELQILHSRKSNSLHDDLKQALSLCETNWHFIPPASPNFGGLWEAGVKSAKFHLKRITNERLLTFEELSTLLCQIEGCLNSRPLAPLTPDPADFDVLTPGHFLIGEPTVCIQEPSLLETPVNYLTRWKYIERLKQHFWKRWRNEYLNRLQARPKWLSPEPNAKVGDLVLIADERCGPGQWQLGRIKETHSGADGHIRVVSILTKNKILKRPISKICFLPGDSPDQPTPIAQKTIAN
ncbi:uncharacterized protein LOC142231374 [Haematobia irritans]|uniref:uncharacterized protein LOC142231374 n=1 Tax=Haematobia irritans TaxID=7368 RepID=UPI003F4F85D5